MHLKTPVTPRSEVKPSGGCGAGSHRYKRSFERMWPRCSFFLSLFLFFFCVFRRFPFKSFWFCLPKELTYYTSFSLSLTLFFFFLFLCFVSIFLLFFSISFFIFLYISRLSSTQTPNITFQSPPLLASVRRTISLLSPCHTSPDVSRRGSDSQFSTFAHIFPTPR